MRGFLTKNFVDRFASVSGAYAAFRPTYPAALFDWLASIAPARVLAWDCATGSGQAARDLCRRFGRVIATDASPDQIARASPDPRIEYRVAPAEDSGLETGSCDLVTVAQALHWFDIEGFFRECDRVLRPGGVLAVWSYGPLRVADDAIDVIVQQLYYDIVGPYWPPERALVDAGYRGIAMLFPELAVPQFDMRAAWPLETLLGYLGSWSATAAYSEATGSDPRELVADALAEAWGERAAAREVSWPLTVRAGRKPDPCARTAVRGER
jgi:SAM-dependent methyltransferase